MPISTALVFCGFILLIQEKDEQRGIAPPEISNNIWGNSEAQVDNLFQKV